MTLGASLKAEVNIVAVRRLFRRLNSTTKTDGGMRRGASHASVA